MMISTNHHPQVQRQKQGCAVGSPVSHTVSDLYMEEVESRAPSLVQTCGLHLGQSWNQWGRGLHFTSSVERNGYFTRDDTKKTGCNRRCTLIRKEASAFNFARSPDTDQYPLFLFSPPTQIQSRGHSNLKQPCWECSLQYREKKKEYFYTTSGPSSCQQNDLEKVPRHQTEDQNKHNNIIIPYAAVSQTFQRIFL